MKTKYKYSITVILRDHDHHILSEKFYFFNSLRELHDFIEVCVFLHWDVVNIIQEVET